MTTHSLQRELGVALRLAIRTGKVIMNYYKTGLLADRKARDEPVTVADHVADHLISSSLKATFPEDGLLTEESDDDLSRLQKQRVWIVDPLDGTAEFIAQTGEFAVQIALAIGGQPVLGVVNQPARGRLFYAVRGCGTYQICDKQITRLHVSAVADFSSMRLVVSRSHCSAFLEAARQALGIRSMSYAGSVGFKISLVTLGECDLYLATTVSKEWDLCAPHALLLEAGGTLSNLHGKPLVYNKPDVTGSNGLIASNSLVHEQIVETLTTLCP